MNAHRHAHLPRPGPGRPARAPEPLATMAQPPPPALTATFAKDKRRREGGEQLRGVREEHGKRACMLTSEPAPATADRAGLPFLAPVGATLRAVTSRTNVNGRPKRGSCCLDHPASHT